MIAAYILLQLVPLPAWLWAVLPGRDMFLEAARVAKISQPWRPIAIVPDLTIDTLLAMVFPFVSLMLLSKLQESSNYVIISFMLFILIGSAILGLLQFFSNAADGLRWYNLTSLSMPVGIFSNRNHQAVFLSIGIPITAIWVRLGTQKLIDIVIAGAASILFIIVIFLSGSRSGFIISFLNIILSVFILKNRPKLSNYPKMRLGFALLTVFVAAVIFLRLSPASTRFHMTNIPELRLQILPDLMKMAWYYFPVGSGFGSFDTVYRIVEPFKMLGLEYLNHAHNDFIEIVIEGGLPALLAIMTFLGLWAWRVVVIWRICPTSNKILYGRLGSVVSASLLLASAVDYPLRTPILAFIFTIACGWIEIAFHERVARPEAS